MREATEQEYGTKTSCQVLCAVSHLLEAGLPPSPTHFSLSHSILFLILLLLLPLAGLPFLALSLPDLHSTRAV